MILEVKTVAFFGEQGTGKTWVTGGVIERLLSDTLEVLLVVPLSNIETTWVEILSKIDITICRDWEEYKKTVCPKILLIHYEMLRALDRKITRRSWTYISFDESHKIKDRNSWQSRIASRKGLQKAKYKVILTGTPFDDIKKDPQQLWAQFRFCRPSVFGTEWGPFDRRYLVPTGWCGKQRKFRKTRLARFLRLIEPYTIRVSQEEALPHLKPIKYHWVPVQLLGRQRKLYEQLEEFEIIDEEDLLITGDLRIVKDGKLHQICGGFVFDDEGDLHHVGKAKLRKLRYMLKRLEPPVVIFCKYLAEVDAIEKMLSGARVATVTGKNRKTRADVNRQFQSGKLDYLIAQVRTGGIGVDLFRAHHGIFYSTTFSFIDFDQALKRLQRDGQLHQVHIWMIYAKYTIDRVVYDAALLKQDSSQMILEYFRRKHERRCSRSPRQRAPVA